MLTRLDIYNVRNLRHVALRELGPVSLIYGVNGSGKSSLLEAIHMLGMGRSFRGAQPRTLIHHDAPECVVHGEVLSRSGVSARGASLGVRRTRGGGLEARVNGEGAQSLADLAERLPLQVLDGAGFELIVGAPLNRRRFLDWGVFHVEHGFLAAWRRFQRALSHRNAVLRSARRDDAEWRVWTRELVLAGEALTRYRDVYFERLLPALRDAVQTFLPEFAGVLECTFRRGWDPEQPLGEAMEYHRGTDEARGFTQVGPQRADLRLRVGNHAAADVLSRGQQKLLACALRLAQGHLFGELTADSGVSVIYLIDDLPAELDADHLALVCSRLAGMRAQVFITAIQPELVLSVWPSEHREMIRMFHVERGMISAP